MVLCILIFLFDSCRCRNRFLLFGRLRFVRFCGGCGCRAGRRFGMGVTVGDRVL